MTVSVAVVKHWVHPQNIEPASHEMREAGSFSVFRNLLFTLCAHTHILVFPDNGNRTKEGILFAQHTDYIFSAVGEELGFIGCLVIMLMELAIISRCIYVGIRCHDYMRRLVCFGVASSLMFQVLINVGMCIGVMPVIGLTMPLISYGGSSVVTIFAMLGLVSGAYARPQSLSYERYIQPYRG